MKLTNEISFLKVELSGVRQRLSDQSVNFNILAQEKKQLQDRLSSIQIEFEGTLKEKDFSAKIIKLEAMIQ